MVKTIAQLSEMLENMQAEADKNAEYLNKILTSINAHLEDMENDTETDDLIKVYLTEYKKALEDRHALVISEFSNVHNSIKNIESKQSSLTQSKDFERFFAVLTNNLQFLQNEFNNQQNSIENLNKAIVNISEDNSDKNEIISAINASKQEFEITNSHFEEYMTNISADTQNILKNLIVMDPTAQNDIVKRELENIYIAVNSILTSIHETEQKADNAIQVLTDIATKEDLSELGVSINGFKEILETLKSDFNTSNEDINILIKDKFEDFTEKVKTIVSTDDFANFRHELADFIQQIVDNSNSLNQNLSIQKDVLENLINTINNFEISKNLDSLTFAMDQIRENSTSNRDAIINEIDNIPQKINNNLDSRANVLEDKISQSASEIKNLQNDILVKLSENNDSEKFQGIHNNIDLLRDTIVSSQNSNSTDFSEKINGLQTVINNGLESRNERFNKIQSAIENFKNEINNFISNFDTNSGNNTAIISDMKSKIEEVATVFTDWNFNQESRDSKLVSMISSEIEKLSESVEELQSSLQAQVHGELSENTNNVKQQVEILTDHIDELKAQLQDTNKTEQFENIQNKIENSGVQINDNINLLRETIEASQNTNTENLHERMNGLQNIINEGLESRNEKFNNIQSAIENFRNEIGNIVTTFETNSGNNISTVNDIKSKIEDIANIFTDWNFSQESRDSKLVSMISAELESLSNTVNELQSSVPAQVHGELSENSTLVKQQIDNLTQYIEELKTTIQNSDQTELFDTVKTKIENSGELINNNINILKESIADALNQDILSGKLLAIKNIISEKADSNDETMRNLQGKIEEFINVGNRISSETEIKMGNSVSELADLKNEIADISSSFKNWDYNREEHDNKMVGMISSELDELKESITTLQDSVQTGIHQELTKNTETIETQLNNIIGYVDSLKDEIHQNNTAEENTNNTSDEDLQSISDKINAVKQELNLVNTDIMDTLNSQAEALMKEISPLKLALDAIVEIKDSIKAEYESLNSVSKNAELFSAINDITEIINEKYQILQKNNDDYRWILDEFKSQVTSKLDANSNSINEMLDMLNQKVDIIAAADSSGLQYDMEEIKDMISSQKELLEHTDADKLSAIEAKLKELTAKLDNVDSSEISDMKESIIEAIINVFEQISFIEEAEDIKDFVEEKTDEINQNINEVKQQLTQFVNGEDQYSYTLQDVESDIAKLRLVLNDLSNTSSQEEISNISNNIHRIVTTVEDLQTSLTQEQISDLKANFEKLSEDVVSISSRTNKLLLTSDESYNALNNGLNDFSNVITQLEERINYLDNKEISERIEEKLDNTYNIVTSSANSDKVMRQALMYMGEWIDTTSENIESLCENTDIQKHKSEEIVSLLDELKETLPEQRQLLDTITVYFDEQQERMDRLEMKLEKILAAIENIDDSRLENKVDKIDKQVKKLSTTMEKLATYVDE